MMNKTLTEKRLAKYQSLSTHAWLKRIWNKVPDYHHQISRLWIKQHGELSMGEYELAVNRLFLDDPKKPALWKEIVELISSANDAETLQ